MSSIVLKILSHCHHAKIAKQQVNWDIFSSHLNGKDCPITPYFSSFQFLGYNVSWAPLYEVLPNMEILFQSLSHKKHHRVTDVETKHSPVSSIPSVLLCFLPEGEHEMESERDAFQQSIKTTPFPPGPICLRAKPQIPFKEVRGQCQTQPKAFCNVFT